MDKREVLDWTDQAGRFITLPSAAGAIHVMQLAESGSGKTVLMYHGITEVLRRGWPVYFIDAKGDPEDADQLAELARALGYSVRIGEPWNLYTGTASQITTKILRTIPLSTGDGAFYRREAEQALRAIQSKAPLTGMRDLFTRLDNPREYVRDQTQLNSLMAPVDKIGTRRNERIRDTLLTALEPLEPYLSAAGWSYGDGGADLTIVPLSPADEAEARVGDLMLLDLRQWMTTRLRGRDKSPGVVFVDEFAQLVTADSDPGDTAGSMFETARSAGLGLWLAVQSVAGISNDETRRERALSSGAALIFGRSKAPEAVVSYAGTVMRLEASGAATGEELRSARAQHTYVVPPQDVRQASIGQFWLVQSGGLINGRALPPKKPSQRSVVAPVADDSFATARAAAGLERESFRPNESDNAVMTSHTDKTEVEFFPDWGHRLPIWMGDLTPEISAELDRDLEAWVRVWQRDLDPVFEVRWASPEQGREWIVEGRRLVAALQRELGDDYVIKPSFSVFDPDRPD